jgi:hypothetical protein
LVITPVHSTIQGIEQVYLLDLQTNISDSVNYVYNMMLGFTLWEVLWLKNDMVVWRSLVI